MNLYLKKIYDYFANKPPHFILKKYFQVPESFEMSQKVLECSKNKSVKHPGITH